MAIQYISPALNRARAEERIQAREYNRRYAEYEAQLKAEEEERARAEQRRQETDTFTRVWHSLGDGVTDILYGAWGFGEGLVDLVAGGVGAVGGLFDSGFQDDVQDFIAEDWGSKFIRNPTDEFFQGSYIHDDKSGIAEGVLNGVGQMLPLVALTIVTGGAGAAAGAGTGTTAAGGAAATAGSAASAAGTAATAAKAAGLSAKAIEALNLGLLGASAAGKGAEEAYNDGAGYYQGLGYGAASGLIEVGTEKMTGGIGAMKQMFGKGVFDGVTKSVADVGVKRVAKEIIGEGVEEIVSDGVNPFAKAIYKGPEAITDAYGSPEKALDTAKNAMKSGVVGSLTAAAMGGVSTITNKITKGTKSGEVGKGADVQASLESIHENYTERTRLDSRGSLTVENDTKIQNNIEQNYRQVETALSKTNQKNRERLINKFGLNGMFDTNTGMMTDEFVSALDLQKGKIGMEINSRYSANMRGRDEQIRSDLWEINEVWNRENGNQTEGKNDLITFAVEDLSDVAQSRFTEVKEFVHNMVTSKSGADIGIVVVDATTTDFHSAINGDNSVIYVSRADLESGRSVPDIVHETWHFTEGTETSNALYTEMKSDAALYTEAAETVARNGYATVEEVRRVMDERAAGNTESIDGIPDATVRTIESELGAAMTEKVLGNENFVHRVVRDNVTLAEKILNRVSDVSEWLSSLKSTEARTEYERFRRFAKMYEKAAEEAGFRYENRRLVRIAREKNGEEVLDNEEEVRYSKTNHEKEGFRDDGGRTEDRGRNESLQSETEKRDADQRGERTNDTSLRQGVHQNARTVSDVSRSGTIRLVNEEGGTNNENDRGRERETIRVEGERERGDNLVQRDRGFKSIVPENYKNDVHGGSVSGTIRLVNKLSKEPVYQWAKGHLVTPSEQSAAGHAKRIASEYGIPCFVVKDSVWDQNHHSAPAFSAKGQIYLKQSIPGEIRDMVVPHEATHVMKQLEYQPYLDFVNRIPEMLVMSDEIANRLLSRECAHCGFDFQHLTKAQAVTLYDEINATIYGNYAKNSTLVRDLISSAFYDFDSYISELTRIHEDFRNELRAYEAENHIRFSKTSTEQRYTYEDLTSKPDMQVTVIRDGINYVASPETRNRIVERAIKNAASVGYTNENGNAVVHVKDIDTDVIVGKNAIRHGLDRRLNVLGPVSVRIGEILQNSVRINEMISKKETAANSYVLIGAAKNQINQPYVVEFVVNSFTGEISQLDVLYSVNAKDVGVNGKEKGTSRALAPEITGIPATLTDSTISISHLLDFVNTYFPDILPEDVLRHFGRSERPDGVLGKSVRFSKTFGESSTDAQKRLNKAVKRIKEGSPEKVYTKKEASSVIDSVVTDTMQFENSELYGNIKGKSRAEVINILWEGMNTSNKDTRAAVALDVADYLIQNSVVEEVVNEEANARYRDTLAAVKPYLHRMNVESIRGDIEHAYGKDGARTFFRLWSAGKNENGIGADVIAEDLRSEQGIHLKSENPADMAIEIDQLYRDSRDALKKKAAERFKSVLSDEEYSSIRKKIVNELLDGFDANGTKSEFLKDTDYYQSEIERMKRRLKESGEYNKAVNRLLDKTQKIKDWKSGTFMNASKLRTEMFKGSVEKLASIKYRGDISKASTRRIVGEVRDWYVSNEKILGDAYNQEVASMLTDIANNVPALTDHETALVNQAIKLFAEAGNTMTDYGDLATWYTKKNLGKQYDYDTKRLLSRIADMHDLTLTDVQNLSKVMEYFKHFVETFEKVYRDGKWTDTLPIAEDYIKVIHENDSLKLGVLDKAIFSGYAKTFSDPMTLARRADRYTKGFFTETLTEWRNGAYAAGIAEMNLRESLDGFYDKNRNWAKNAEKEKVAYGGQKITKREAIQAYMTLQRDQLIPGAVLYGFSHTDGKNITRIDGLMKDTDGVTMETVKAKAEETIRQLRSQFDDTDLEFIRIAEDVYKECREIKRKTDIQRQGYSNVEEGYYVPGRRANVARSIDVNYTEEAASVNNQSFNKSTVKGAKGELWLEPADLVLDRHIKGITQYAALSNAMDNFDRIVNLDVGGTPNKPTTVKTEATGTWKDFYRYFENLRNDIRGVSKDRDGFNHVVGNIRSRYATFQLGANLKVLATQTSSLFASTSILDYKDIIRGFTLNASDVDQYCEVAKLRNYQRTAALAQGVLDKKSYSVTSKIDKISNLLMEPIGKMDRFVVKRLYGASQAYVERVDGLKIGTQENKVRAGEILTNVIIETQQNSVQTERSAAMRSSNEIIRTFTMFTADSMKVTGRTIDAIGEVNALKERIRMAADPAEKAALRSDLKNAKKRARKALAAQVSVALVMCAIAQGFRTLYNKDDDDENIAKNMIIDAIGNMLGGLPLIKDVYSKLFEGYDFDNYALSAANDLLNATTDIFDTAQKVVAGEVKTADFGSSVKKTVFAIGQLTGLPTRNVYNVVYGLTNRFSPSTAYKIDTAFYNKNYRSDLEKAIERGDEKMISTIAGIMLDENGGGIEDSATRKELNRLVCAGYDVLPSGEIDSFTYEGNTIQLTKSQKKQFNEVYAEAIPAVTELINSSMYGKASDEIREKAIRWIYSLYRELAIDSLLDLGTESKNELFSKIIDLPSLAIIAATCNAMESDVDKEGNTVTGSRRKKIEKYIQSLRLTAAEKYMIMGYFGYKNQNGRSVVRAKIQSLRLTKEQKEKLFAYCGYAA